MGEVSALADKLHCEVIPADATSVEFGKCIQPVQRKCWVADAI